MSYIHTYIPIHIFTYSTHTNIYTHIPNYIYMYHLTDILHAIMQ